MSEWQEAQKVAVARLRQYRLDWCVAAARAAESISPAIRIARRRTLWVF